MFQNQNVPIMVKSVPVTAYCAHDAESNMFKIMGVGDACPDVIDIGEDVALGMCNTTDLESANALLDVGARHGGICSGPLLQSPQSPKEYLIGSINSFSLSHNHHNHTSAVRISTEVACSGGGCSDQ